uniref:serine/threonine-protein kinase LATS2-like isoform X1 n=2 Tax=Oncorhynchus gorbuscha TaxID=8017 RepID=UPI001EAF4BB0|nr:serine/threonine-protein kinase LATS2-like isoform X1 [Oncorhynchus gorbuscha]XP_046219497.1 serine/threonine-protein kinase LATS2-like isoform X1 [Oncorhynchus gorbuscha]XP_046219498.1 serine/threonine-protein kinase LATS2-like isoform X1 [Oncorhynchus gorbuscha]XP_046219499.1 serine/threonine-protein kinase LATS2-like isoform X1 [Oncorhynchus gorbuscha]
MRPKTFPAAPYMGNTRQRLQEIKEGLKQPAKLMSQALHGGSSRGEGGRGAESKSKDPGSRQQQHRPPQKFNNYQNALREIRKSLRPFEYKSGPSSGSAHPAGDVNRQMLQELVNTGCDQEMAVRALKQTGSRNIEAALEYISKMGYLDPRNELIVRIIKQTSPGKGGMPNSIDHRPPLEGTSEGAMPPYHQMGASMYEGAGYGPEGPYMGAPPVMNYMIPPSGTAQGPAMVNPMGRPPSIGAYPPSMVAQNNPGNPMYPPGAPQKAYPGSMEQAMIGYSVPGQPLQPQAPGGPIPVPHYDYGHGRPHMMEPSGYGIKRSASFQNKMPPLAPDNYVNMQVKGAMGQNGGGYPPNLYLPPHSHPRQSSPTSHQVHMMSRSPGGAAAAMGPDFSDLPQGLLTPSRASLNLDLYEQHQHHWAGPQGPEGAPPARQPQPQGPFRGEVRVPSRTNSFNNRSAPPNNVRPTLVPPAPGKQDPSLGPPNTITAVTSPPIQQPVKSIRVMRPEPKTAVGPCHPGWLAAQEASEPLTYMPEEAYTLEPAQEPRCPPPPYPKTLLISGASSEAGPLEASDLNTPARPHGSSGGGGGKAEESQVREKTKSGKGEKAVKDKKQIQTSPVPVRKNGRDQEKRESRIKSYSPFAFKFYMEQHVENVMKTHQEKLNRRLQLEQEMSKAGLSEAEQEQMRKMLNQKESNYNRLRRAKMDKAMFVKIKTLGIGAFGEVCLTRKVDTGALYAMKTLRKKDVLNRNQVAHVKAERDILAEADNEWVVRLYYSFQDRDSLYFVMDYIPGGDMMSLLIRMGVFPEPLACFYVAELTLAIESVHKMGFIHRDIKPDNILIDLDGHIKLTDFGLCTGFRWTHNSKYYQKGSHIRQDSMEPSDFWDDVSNCRCGDRLQTLEQRATRQHQRCLAHSLVGTPNYIAPEVLLRKGYTQLCDWWSVGVILFEMLVGHPPFLAPTPTETQIKVINWESTLQVPPQVKLSPEAVDIIGRLCCSPEERLGSNGACEIKTHPFFDQMDFSSNLRTQPAPYRPKIAHPMDTSNFDPVEEEGGPGAWSDSGDSTRAWETLCTPHGKHPEHAFYEFTFRRFFDDNGCPFRYPKPPEISHSQGPPSSSRASSMGPEEEEEEEEEEEQGEPVYV